MAGKYLNDQQVKALVGSKKLYKMPIANALSVFVEPINKSTGYTCKRIVGNDRWYDPIKKKKVQVNADSMKVLYDKDIDFLKVI